MTAWRITKRRYANQAFSGEGARINGGRWTSPGRAAVYVSETQALATLEVLAGLGSTGPLPAYVLFEVIFDDSLVTTVGLHELEDGWDGRPATSASRRVGDGWLEARATAILRVPSVIVPAEGNYILNPAHEDFGRICIGPQMAFPIDPRLRGTGEGAS